MSIKITHEFPSGNNFEDSLEFCTNDRFGHLNRMLINFRTLKTFINYKGSKQLRNTMNIINYRKNGRLKEVCKKVNLLFMNMIVKWSFPPL